MLIIFILMRLIPGDPVYLLISPDSDPKMIEQLREELHLDRPIWVQFGYYLQNIFKGDFGISYTTGNLVLKDIQIRFPATLELITYSMILSIIISIPLGIMSAVKKDGWIDHFSRIISLVGVAMPGFWLGLLLIFFFFYTLNLLPPPMGRISLWMSVQRVTGFFTIDTLLNRDIPGFISSINHLILPTFALAFRNIAAITRLTRSSMLDVLDADYIRTAKAMGFRDRVIVYKYALRNAIIIPLTQVGVRYGQLIGGAVIVETIFAWPGLGFWMITAAKGSDYNPVQAFVILAAVFMILIFLIVDILHFLIDPRVS